MQRRAGQDGSLRLQGGVAVAPASLSLLTHTSLPVGSSLPVPSTEPSNSCHALDSRIPCAYSQAQIEVKGTAGPLYSSSSSKDIVNFRCHFNRQTAGGLRVKSALSIGYRQSNNAKAWESFNRSVRWNCSTIPLGLASLNQEPFGKQENLDNGEEGEGGRDDAAAGSRPKVVLILMSDTGGGHRASAEAIKTTFALEYGDEYKVIVTDLWTDHTPWPFNQLPKSYNFLVKHSTLWKFTFHGTAPRLIHQPHFAVTSAFIARKVMRGLLNHKPDVIVSVHPLMQHIPLRILKAKGLLKKIPFTTVITDLSTCHPTWFHRLVTRCFCPTKEVAERAQKAGLRPSQIRVYGLPIRPSFCKALRSKVELRRELGIDEELPAVLLMGGGEGMGPVEATARALGKSLYDEQTDRAIGQLVVICGKNKRLIKRLQAISWPMPVQIRGFEMNMNEWMGACDCIITKAGPGTIAEAMICGLPLLLNDYIAGQETGNVPYVVDNGAGKFCKDPKKIAHIVAEWFGPKQGELQQMSQNSLKLARPDAVFKIVHDLDELARQKDSLPEHVLALT